MLPVVNVPHELPIAFGSFAAAVGPQVAKRDKNGRAISIAPGTTDEVWLKLIKSRHGAEKHTMSEWYGLIDSYRNQPAYGGGN